MGKNLQVKPSQGQGVQNTRPRFSKHLGLTAWGIAGFLLLTAPAGAAGDLVIEPRLPMVVALLTFFTLLIFPVNALIFKPIFRALDERHRRIEGARERARQVDSETRAVLARCEASLREAWEEAEAARKERLGQARAEQVQMTTAMRAQTEETVHTARTELAESLAQARADLSGISRDLAASAARQILGREL